MTGRRALQLTTGEELAGRWVEGGRTGTGSCSGPRLARLGVHQLVGQYEEGVLTGPGKAAMCDDTVREGWFQHGYLHGPCLGRQPGGELSWIGHYRAGIPTGLAWQAVGATATRHYCAAHRLLVGEGRWLAGGRA